MCQMREKKRKIELLALAVTVVVLDRVSKFWVLEKGFPVWVNSGGAFSVLDHWPYFGVLPFLAFILLFGWMGMDKSTRSDLAVIGFVFLFSGSISNLADRVLWGGVVDFFQFFPRHWFNLADIAIALGIVFVLLERLLQKWINRFGVKV